MRTLHAATRLRARARGPRALRLAATVALAGGLLLGAGCETKTEGGGDGGTVFCMTDSQCPSGTNCSFPIDVGCSALGECRDLAPPADTSECSAAMTLCACDGTTVSVPPCWNYLAPKAIASMGACGTDGGAADAPAD